MNKFSGMMFKVGTDNDWIITDSFASALQYFYMVDNVSIIDAITGKVLLRK